MAKMNRGKPTDMTTVAPAPVGAMESAIADLRQPAPVGAMESAIADLRQAVERCVSITDQIMVGHLQVGERNGPAPTDPTQPAPPDESNRVHRRASEIVELTIRLTGSNNQLQDACEILGDL